LSTSETIAAVATPPGRGGVGVVRIAGPAVPAIAHALLGRLPEPRVATFGAFCESDGRAIDAGLALYFPAPRSFTGDDILELHGHGGPVVMDLLLARVLALGARLARPGEFSERAFLNGKLDLAQAEAVADLIASDSAQAARAAMRSLEGALSAEVHTLVEALVELRVYVESAIDFPEEEIDFLTEGGVRERLEGLLERLRQLAAGARHGQLLREGMRVVIAGRPNAGKSSLLNCLAGREAAIVTEVPGTTRDVLREHIHIDGMPLHVIDTAGLRESEDRIEREGVRRAWLEIRGADRVLLVMDDRDGDVALDGEFAGGLEGMALTVVRNKIDLTGRSSGLADGPLGPEVAVSALTGLGLEALRTHLKSCVGYEGSAQGTFIARRRHLEALARAESALERGREQLGLRAGELLAEELRAAQQALGEITGEFTTEDLLDRIFSSFCIGK
jgi:tRNA modification GTPase